MIQNMNQGSPDTSPPLRPYQRRAVEQLLTHLSEGRQRVTLDSPCGTGKTITAAHVVDAVPGRIVVAVPTLALLDQTVGRVTAVDRTRPVLRVGSRRDESPTEDDLEMLAGSTTNADVIREFLRVSESIIVATYASLARVVEAATDLGIVFDLLIADEAHRTVGDAEKQWALAVDEDFPAQRRLFMTATVKVVDPPPDLIEEIGHIEAANAVTSMSSLHRYGPHVTPLTVRQAIDEGWLSDYRVLVIAVPTQDVRAQLESLTQVVDNYSLQEAASHVALSRALINYPEIRSVLAFHNTIRSSQEWTERLPAVHSELAKVDTVLAMRQPIAKHIDGTMAEEQRREALDLLGRPGDNLVVVSNCRVLAEGVDVPALDAVLFAAARTSGTDIVQCVGRGMRPHPEGDRLAYVILPVVIPSDEDPGIAERDLVTSTHGALWRVLTSLREVDELMHTSLLRYSMNGPRRDDVDDEPLIIDIPEGISEASIGVMLQAIEHTIPMHDRTAAVLSEFVAQGKTPNPPASREWRGFPLGKRVAAARAARRSGTLARTTAESFDAIPGFDWNPGSKRAKPMTADQWIDRIEHYTGATGAQRIDETAVDLFTDPDTGNTIRPTIGKWLHDWRGAGLGRNLTVEQHARVQRLLPKQKLTASRV